jgi:hypothetical protein
MLEKQTFDWMRQQLTGFMRTQIIAAAATLSLAEHFHYGPRTVADIQGALIDLHMLMLVGGRERSVSRYENLLQQADLSLTAITPLPSGYVLMEATATGER